MPPELKILHVIESTTGGTRRHLVDLVSGLDKDRIAVSVICSTLRDKAFLDDIAAMSAMGVDVSVIQMVRRISPLRDVLALTKIYRYMQRGKFSVVHTHSAKAGFLGRVAARLAGIPFVIHTPHVFPFDIETGPMRKALYLFLERIAARFTNRIICVCRSQKDDVIKRGLVHPDKLLVIENGICGDAADGRLQRQDACRELGLGAKSSIVGTIGRFSCQKGHRFLLQAAAVALTHFPDTTFVFVGEGELKREMSNLAYRLGVSDNCSFLEPRDNTAALMSAFDIVAIPSLWEGLPYVLLEAMAAGNAIVASGVGGITDTIVTGDNGLLVPPRDVVALAESLVRLLADPGLRERLGASARESLAKMPDRDAMVNATQSLYLA